MTNCPNCGAPITGHKCEYCGAIIFDFASIEVDKPIFDFASIEVDKPVWINFKLGERWVLAHVLPESASMYADGTAQATFRKPAPTRIEMDFIELPTDKGYGHIVSERGVVSSTDLEV